MLLDYFTKDTEGTVTGAKIGMEVETDFIMIDTRAPISTEISRAIRETTDGKPAGCELKLELGRQKIEINIAPEKTGNDACASASEALLWLRLVAKEYGAEPYWGPEISWREDLLLVEDERDSIWVDLDGREALEQLCRCSSVQFMVDVNPADAIRMINRLWEAHYHDWDYSRNDRRQRAYMALSEARYRPDRYGGPAGFLNMSDYVHQLAKHNVVMHKGKRTNMPLGQLRDPNIDLFLRSVWWHYRLRRFGDTLALEIRPTSRRNDYNFDGQWRNLSKIIGI